ncbi:hypothetical protein GCM10022235_36360 [Kribbella ginsengisoli]|uniref:Uncharacterized protein n=1 Tax=Kribbella ginsengisoli TaxID=363865 RepID=A0ABP6XCN4_9ACTN
MDHHRNRDLAVAFGEVEVRDLGLVTAVRDRHRLLRRLGGLRVRAVRAAACETGHADGRGYTGDSGGAREQEVATSDHGTKFGAAVGTDG